MQGHGTVRIPASMAKQWKAAEYEIYRQVPIRDRAKCSTGLVIGVAVHAVLEYAQHGGIKELVNAYIADPQRTGYRYVADEDDNDDC